MALGKKTGGRVKGTPNKSTAEIKALAMKHAPAAIAELSRLAIAAESETARVAAIRELLDRGIGKAIQEIVSTNTTKVEHSFDFSSMETHELEDALALAEKLTAGGAQSTAH